MEDFQKKINKKKKIKITQSARINMEIKPLADEKKSLYEGVKIQIVL